MAERKIAKLEGEVQTLQERAADLGRQLDTCNAERKKMAIEASVSAPSTISHVEPITAKRPRDESRIAEKRAAVSETEPTPKLLVTSTGVSPATKRARVTRTPSLTPAVEATELAQTEPVETEPVAEEPDNQETEDVESVNEMASAHAAEMEDVDDPTDKDYVPEESSDESEDASAQVTPIETEPEGLY